MSDSGSVVILSDGDLPALVALAHASEARVARHSDVVEQSVWLWPVQGAASGGLLQTLSRQVSGYSGEIVEHKPEASTDADSLLAAGRHCSTIGVRKLIWPASGGAQGDAESIDIERASAIADTAMLVERLLEIESPNAPMIDVPFADLSDRQIAELAIDMGVIPGDVWWGRQRSDAEVLASERWRAAFAAAGVELRRPEPEAATRPALRRSR